MSRKGPNPAPDNQKPPAPPAPPAPRSPRGCEHPQSVRETPGAMFGFIFTQPIHKTLRQMRLATIFLLIVSVDIMYRLVEILRVSGEMSGPQVAATVGTLAAAVFACIWKGIANLAEPHKDDD